MSKEFRLDWDFRIEKHLEEDGKFYISGFASIADRKDRNRPLKIITEKAIQESLKDLDVNNVLFFEHNRSEGVGKIVEKKYIPGVGIWIKALISSTATKVRKLIEEGILTGLSIGANILDCAERVLESGETVLEVLKMELIEVSLVFLPASLDTRVLEYEIIKAYESKGGEKMDNQELIEEIEEEKRVEEEIKNEVKVEPETVQPETTQTEVVKELNEGKIEGEVEEGEKKLTSEGESKDERGTTEKEIEEKEKGKDYYYYYEGLIDKLKEALKAKDEKELREAIAKIIDELEDYYKDYYGKCCEKYGKPEKKEEDKAEIEAALKAHSEDIQKITALIEELGKRVEEFNSKPILTEREVREIVKEMIKDIPDPSQLRKGLAYIERKEEEEKGERKTSVSERIKEVLKERFRE